ncbi:MAG: helix-turn-helix transcriptional regulator [Deltaproteobacteria bacterium]|nr:helix-turn-helix transcriptional regulator [Deltaproteobacteria bacterium]
MEEHIGDRLRRARVAAGFESLAALARVANVHTETIWRYEAGRIKPSIEKLHSLAKTLDVRMEWLVSGDGPMRPTQHPPPADEAA